MTTPTEWQRAMAAKIADANPLRPSRVSQIKPGAIKARGVLLCAINDEPEDDESTVIEEDEDDDDICIHCNGSGEGQYDGTRCSWCKGRGAIHYRDED